MYLKRLLLTFGSGCATTRSEQEKDIGKSAAEVVSVNVGTTVRPVERRIVGINTNYLTDHAAIRAAGQGYERGPPADERQIVALCRG